MCKSHMSLEYLYCHSAAREFIGDVQVTAELMLSGYDSSGWCCDIQPLKLVARHREVKSGTLSESATRA